MIDLDKVQPGEVIELDKVTGAPVKNLRFILKWNKKATDGGYDFDPDASAFVCGSDGKVLGGDAKNFVRGFGGNTQCPGGGVVHSGDDTTGALGGEKIDIHADQLLPGTTHVDLSVTIFRAKAREHTFGKIGSVVIEIVDLDSNKTVATGKLSFKNSVHNAVNAAKVLFEDGQLYPTLLQEGFTGGLSGIATGHGVPIGSSRYDDGPAQG